MLTRTGTGMLDEMSYAKFLRRPYWNIKRDITKYWSTVKNEIIDYEDIQKLRTYKIVVDEENKIFLKI